MTGLGFPVVPFYSVLGGGFPDSNRLQKKEYPYSNLSTGGPRQDAGCPIQDDGRVAAFASLAEQSPSWHLESSRCLRGAVHRWAHGHSAPMNVDAVPFGTPPPQRFGRLKG